jgi:hypothetical protein
VVLFLAAWGLFNRCCAETGESLPRPVKVSAGGSRRGRYPRAWKRALAWKDFHFLTGGARGMLVRMVMYAALVAALFLWLQSIARVSFGKQGTGNLFRWTGVIIFTAELGVLASQIFGRERKRQTLGGLYTLPMSPWQLIRQKVGGCLPALLPSLVIWWIGLAILRAWQTELEGMGRAYRPWNSPGADERTMEIVMNYFTVAEYALFAVLVAYQSLRMRRGALIVGFCIMLFGNILLVSIVEFFTGGLRGPNYAAQAGWYGCATVVLFVFTIRLAYAIPKHLTACAAEE